MLRYDKEIPADDLVALYSSVGWTSYTQHPEWLQLAVAGSDFVVTEWSEGGELIALARAITDGHSILYLQDILVRPDHQRQGLGRKLLSACLAAYPRVRRKVLLTDDDESQHRLYNGADFTRLSDYADGLNAYIRVD